jgi:hypothetical protein
LVEVVINTGLIKHGAIVEKSADAGHAILVQLRIIAINTAHAAVFTAKTVHNYAVLNLCQFQAKLHLIYVTTKYISHCFI